jgi:hypothetical protein
VLTDLDLGPGPGWSGAGGLGSAAAVVGDLDQDGSPEVALGATVEDAVWIDGGRADWTGDRPVAAAGVLRVQGSAAGELGAAVLGVGDMDGDGWAELALGARYAVDGAGEVWLLSPGADGLSGTVGADAARTRVLGRSSYDFLGGEAQALARLDRDGDGLADLAMGAPGSDTPGEGAGRAYILDGDARGHPAVLTADDATVLLDGPVGGGDAWAGQALAGLDWDGDGYGDLAVGAPWTDEGALDGGAVLVFLSPAPGRHAAADADAVVLGDGASAALGSALAVIEGLPGGAGLAVGAPGLGDGGATLQFAGGATGQLGASDAVRVIVSPAPGAELGHALGAGDLDGDGAPQLAIAGAGSVWLLHLGGL